MYSKHNLELSFKNIIHLRIAKIHIRHNQQLKAGGRKLVQSLTCSEIKSRWYIYHKEIQIQFVRHTGGWFLICINKNWQHSKASSFSHYASHPDTGGIHPCDLDTVTMNFCHSHCFICCILLAWPESIKAH